MRPAQREASSLVAASAACVVVALGLTRGFWSANIHNGVLGVTLSAVGAWLVVERPRSKEGVLFLAAGALEALIFTGRQLGHSTDAPAAAWLGWIGVWPIAMGLLLTTLAVVCFPDGHLPSPGWRAPVVVACALSAVCATLSALWPVEWASAGLTGPPPFSLPGRAVAATAWQVLAHPLYLALQLSWVVAVAVRWRARRSRAPLLCVLVGVAAVFVVLTVGLVTVRSATPGLITVSVIPLLAGWSAVHGHVLTRYRALAWLTDVQTDAAALPTALAKATATALDADCATVWMGDESALRAVGVWPRQAEPDPGPCPFCALPPLAWPVSAGGQLVGALGVPGVTVLSRSEEQMLQNLSAQAALILDRLTLADLARRESDAGRLMHLTPRERDVLELMARGLSNAAISRELHLSVKTVEPLVSTVFAKLELSADPDLNRRVLAALEYHRA